MLKTNRLAIIRTTLAAYQAEETDQVVLSYAATDDAARIATHRRVADLGGAVIAIRTGMAIEVTQFTHAEAYIAKRAAHFDGLAAAALDEGSKAQAAHGAAWLRHVHDDLVSRLDGKRAADAPPLPYGVPAPATPAKPRALRAVPQPMVD